jgi:hypothetical protein
LTPPPAVRPRHQRVGCSSEPMRTADA